MVAAMQHQRKIALYEQVALSSSHCWALASGSADQRASQLVVNQLGCHNSIIHRYYYIKRRYLLVKG